MDAGRYRAGVDIGGTFTDLLLLDEHTGETIIGKILTTPGDPSVAVIQGLQALLAERGLDPATISATIHGTTLITNAIIERKGAKTGLITTQGFRDALEIGREKRYDIYDIFLENPEPLVPRALRREVGERLDETGRMLIPLNRMEVLDVVQGLLRDGVEALAVVLLHSFRNPAHERIIREVVESEFPSLTLSLSSDVMPEIREFERTSTTVANVYVKPIARRYLNKLRAEVQQLGLRGDLYIMLSNGGITTCETASDYPIRLIESGPAAGALAASFYSQLKGLDHVISFDMGGTTAKICVIDQGQPMVTTEFEVARVYRFKKGSGLPVKVPVIEMIEIGAGGGSIARIDELGLLKVGPHSAGADPGPACYDLGGSAPTVTDADLLLGYLDAEYFLGGRMRLARDRAEEAIRKQVAEPLRVDLTRAAWGIHHVVNENMANAARIHLVERGRDQRRYSLIAFGGAGPVHAYRVAEKLKLRQIICPPAAGVTSAFGFLVAPMAFDFVQTYLTTLRGIDFAHLNTIFAEMETRGRALLRQAGVPEEAITVTRSADMRYLHQGFEINVPVPSGRLGADDIPRLQDNFDQEYERMYKRLNPDVDVEALNWRVIVAGPRPTIQVRHTDGRTSLSQPIRKGERPAYFPETSGYLQCPVYDRYQLAPGMRLHGPAIVEERESTVVVGPGARVEVDAYQNVVIMLPT
ncbi:MAG TPA: hydantoinase/oxoprolinase family protein [Candidatus Tectomicrobia bacterium]|nr:hydantoinase/oxoprolinase family protein [Candidatus Tectomicrobia bacterium]